MSIENETDGTTAVDQTLIALARKWGDVTMMAERDCALPEYADMLALSCLLLAAEWDDQLTESVNPVIEENAALAEKRWSIHASSDMEKLVWRLCRRDTETESMRDEAVESLIKYLTHHNSDIRSWAIKLGWMARPWLPDFIVVRRMLKNVADTLGGVRLAMGLASGLCATDNDLETFIAEYKPEEYVEQYADRIKTFRKEGFFLSRAELLDLESGCRRIVEQEIFIGTEQEDEGEYELTYEEEIAWEKAFGNSRTGRK